MQTRATTGDHRCCGLLVDHRLDRVSEAPESQKTRETYHVPGCLDDGSVDAAPGILHFHQRQIAVVSPDVV